MLQPLHTKVAILGMDRIGTGACNLMHQRCCVHVVVVDFSAETVAAHQAWGPDVVLGDAADPDFWEMLKMPGRFKELELILLAMLKHRANMFVLE